MQLKRTVIDLCNPALSAATGGILQLVTWLWAAGGCHLLTQQSCAVVQQLWLHSYTHTEQPCHSTVLITPPWDMWQANKEHCVHHFL